MPSQPLMSFLPLCHAQGDPQKSLFAQPKKLLENIFHGFPKPCKPEVKYTTDKYDIESFVKLYFINVQNSSWNRDIR
jgi:hypothetical protein